MNSPELFIAGIIVTLIVAGALGLVLYGAVLDGRNSQANDTGVQVYPGEKGDSAPAGGVQRAEMRGSASSPSDVGGVHVARDV